MRYPHLFNGYRLHAGERCTGAGQLPELGCYKLEPAAGVTHADVLREAHKIRTARGAAHIAAEHLADAIEAL